MSSLNDKLHPELKSLPFVAKVISFMMKKKLGFKFFDMSSKGTVGKKAEGIFNDTEYIKSKNGGSDIRLRIFRPDTDSKKVTSYALFAWRRICNGNAGTVIGYFEVVY